MSEAADRARLRWELQEASWCWDNWVEEHMAQFGISEKSGKIVAHGRERVEDAIISKRLCTTETMGAFLGDDRDDV